MASGGLVGRPGSKGGECGGIGGGSGAPRARRDGTRARRGAGDGRRGAGGAAGGAGRRVRDARIQVATDTVDVEAASAGALEHVLEYLAWTRYAAVSRGLNMDKMPGIGLVVAVLQKEKRQETGRKLTKGEKKACKRKAGAYMTPPVEPRFLDPVEWDRFVAPPGRRVPTRGPASGVERAQRRRKMAQKRAAAWCRGFRWMTP